MNQLPETQNGGEANNSPPVNIPSPSRIPHQTTTKCPLVRSFSERGTRPQSLVLNRSCGGAAEEDVADNDSVVSNADSIDTASLQRPKTFHRHNSLESSTVSTHPGRSHKFVLHCQHSVGPTERYLTPTQRREREVRQLRATLAKITRVCDEKTLQVDELKEQIDRLQFVISHSNYDYGPSSLNSGSESLCLSASAALGVGNGTGSGGSGSRDANNRLEDSGIVVSQGTTPNSATVKGGAIYGADRRRFSSSGADSATSTTLLNSATTCSIGAAFNSSTSSSGTGSIKVGGVTAGTSGINSAKNVLCSSKGDDTSDGEDISYEDSLKRISEDDGEDGWNVTRLKQEMTALRRKYRNLKERYNDRTETLLQRLSELNGRYLELRPAYEASQERIRHLENELSSLRKDIETQEEWHSQMYLKMYKKGQEAAKFEHADEILELASSPPSGSGGLSSSVITGALNQRITVAELAQQLQRTERELERVRELYRSELFHRADTAAAAGGDGDISGATASRQAEYTLRFLKDAVFYYLTDKDNRGHLNAIQGILGFSEAERIAVAKTQHRRLSLSRNRN